MTLDVAVTGLFSADERDFVSHAVDRLDLGLDGIAGDRHAGATRKTGAREPWHPRGTVIRNDRQVSILSAEELAETAALMGLPTLPAEWIGANITVAGMPALSQLAPMSRLMAPSGATIVVTAYNAPCRQSGRAIAARSGVAAHEFGFVKAASGRRGLVGYVERPGLVRLADVLTVVAPRRFGQIPSGTPGGTRV
ncbi:MOSC domain-containing protein [Phreatobacter stygius]|uniref:MOSC domain-containing protein n=1 Tax=Phreatobacter stygius TaxID=1940610 RepID=UPI001B8B257B|nr:MOSC domain-containing protein [Phreatobacter stygius]